MSRFQEPQDPDFQRLNASISFDRRLWPQDIAQSRAHARMLADREIISEADRDALLAGLDAVASELEDGSFPFAEEDEDIHMAIERRLTEVAGPVGGRLHTARSRNDQVATDLSMYTRERSIAAREAVGALMKALLDRAEEHIDWPMPGYTHLQRAQPVYLGHHLLAYFWMLARDRGRFSFAEREASRLPLGAGALAGVNFDTDRLQVARELGFSYVAPNSIDAVSGRDFVLDYLAAAATCATHLSRLGAELVLWSTTEFGFCELPDSWSSGSSIMPQKKNPDAAELLRAKAPRVVGHLSAFHGVLHALPLTYNKDLQEDKEHLFDAVDTLERSLAAATGMISRVRFDRERMREAAADELIAATDVADLLVRLGTPFREAHGIVAGLVRTALDQGKPLSELTPQELSAHSETLAEHAQELKAVLGESSWLESKVSEGGTSLPRVEQQLALARTVLDGGASA
ncbi:MAG TPA: argininosuccinate lyase [Solirubrobacteraceae bacterium]|jgi:argininosuccinate lyase|nr:argininosuccinate lyase [Solirubrobacteraceae bacterium]